MNSLGDSLVGELDAMWRFGLHLSTNKHDAEELVQQTCVQALENAHRYENRGRLRSWLFRIQHRIWLNMLRSQEKRKENQHVISGVDAASSYPAIHAQDSPGVNSKTVSIDNSASPESVMQLGQVFNAVEKLPEGQRVVVVLVCIEGFSYRETADVLEIPEGTVMSRLARARVTLGKTFLSASEKQTVNSHSKGYQSRSPMVLSAPARSAQVPEATVQTVNGSLPI